jgi:hypothetical protein
MASAVQSNHVDFNQAGLQVAGVGGNGGNGNAAIGGGVSVFALEKGSVHGSIGSDAIMTGANSADNGGDGSFLGSLVDKSVAVYDPINIAMAGSYSSANPDQNQIVHLAHSAIGSDLALGTDIALQLLTDHHLLGHAV